MGMQSFSIKPTFDKGHGHLISPRRHPVSSVIDDRPELARWGGIGQDGGKSVGFLLSHESFGDQPSRDHRKECALDPGRKHADHCHHAQNPETHEAIFFDDSPPPPTEQSPGIVSTKAPFCAAQGAPRRRFGGQTHGNIILDADESSDREIGLTTLQRKMADASSLLPAEDLRNRRNQPDMLSNSQ